MATENYQKVRRFFLPLVALSLVLGTTGCLETLQLSSLSSKEPGNTETDEAAIARFASAKSVLKMHCVSCHQSGGSASFAPLDYASEAEFVARGYVVPQNVDASSILYRTIHYSGPKIASKNMPIGASGTSFTQAHYDSLKDWVSKFGVKTPVDNVEISQFTCDDDSQTSVTKSLMLNKVQYQNAITDLFGAATLTAASDALSALSNESNSQDTFERVSLINPAQLDAYSQLAEAVSTYVAGNKTLRESAFGTCSSLATPSVTCIDGFLNGFAEKILRRPLTADEKTFAKDLANSGGSYQTNLSSVLSYFLQSPYFLWRIETGVGDPTNDRTNLTQYELATRLSFMTTDSIPDSTLLAAAKAGKLATAAQIKAETKRLLSSVRGQKKLAKAFVWWAMADRSQDFSSLPNGLVAGVKLDGLPDAMASEAETFVTEIIFKDNGSFRDLLTSKKSFANHAGLAAIYGHSPVMSNASPATFSHRRQGLLMRASFLTWDTFRSSIIHRGVDFQKRFLCNTIPAPTADIADDRDSQVLTHDELMRTSNRDAVAHQTKSPVCMSCHATINPTGFAFESFDPLGRFRTNEKVFEKNGTFIREIAVDSSTTVPLPGGKSVDVSDAFDLVSYVAKSPEGSACATKSLYRYLNEKIESKSDGCELKRAHQIMSQPDQPILDAVVELIAHEHVSEKVF